MKKCQIPEANTRLVIDVYRIVADLRQEKGLIGPEDIEEAITDRIKLFNALTNMPNGVELTAEVRGVEKSAVLLGIPVSTDDETYRMLTAAVLRPICQLGG